MNNSTRHRSRETYQLCISQVDTIIKSVGIIRKLTPPRCFNRVSLEFLFVPNEWAPKLLCLFVYYCTDYLQLPTFTKIVVSKHVEICESHAHSICDDLLQLD